MKLVNTFLFIKFLFMYRGLMLLQNLNDIELMICLRWSFTDSQLICSISFCPLCALLFKFRQNHIDLFILFLIYFNLLFKLEYQAEQA